MYNAPVCQKAKDIKQSMLNPIKEELALNKIEIFPVTGLPIVKEGDDLSSLICQAAEKQVKPKTGTPSA